MLGGGVGGTGFRDRAGLRVWPEGMSSEAVCVRRLGLLEVT